MPLTPVDSTRVYTRTYFEKSTLDDEELLSRLLQKAYDREDSDWNSQAVALDPSLKRFSRLLEGCIMIQNA